MPSRKPAPLPLMVMPAAEIAALAVAPGDLVEYRTARFLPDQPCSACTVDEVTPEGVIALCDGQRLHRRDLVYLRHAERDLAPDHVSHRPGPRGQSGEFAEGDTGEQANQADQTDQSDPSDPSDPSFPAHALTFQPVPSAPRARPDKGIRPRTCVDCRWTYQPTGNRQIRCAPCGELVRRADSDARHARQREANRAAAGKSRQGQHVTDADRDRWLEACHRVTNLVRAGTHLPEAVAQVAPDFAGIGITIHTYHWWAARFRKEGLLLHIRKPAARKGPALVSLPPPGGADEPPAPAPAPATGAAAADQAAPAAAAAGAPIPEGVRGSELPRPPACAGTHADRSETTWLVPPASPLSDLAKRLRGYADLLDRGAELAARAAAALVVLDTYPTTGE